MVLWASPGYSCLLMLPSSFTAQRRQNQNVEHSQQIFVALFFSATAKSLQSCLTLCDPIDGSPPGSPPAHHATLSTTLRPWDSPSKNTGVGCHFLLQCMKVKSESEVAQSCPTFCDPMDYSLPGSSVHGIVQARILKWGCHSHL